MRFIVVTETNTVSKDNVSYDNLDLSSCNIPDNVWALQWYDNNTGSIEYNTADLQNTDITTLPEWATACETVWQTARDAELAAQAAAEAEAAAKAAAEAEAAAQATE